MKKSGSTQRGPAGQKFHLGKYGGKVEKRIIRLQESRFAEKLWAKDASLWKKDTESKALIGRSLGWLESPQRMGSTFEELWSFIADVRKAGFQHALLMGMGGSSLAPLLFSRTFRRGRNSIPVTVLDTTDPATILRLSKTLPLDRTLFIVASKSGSTAEPAAFHDYFFHLMTSLKGPRAGENFVAITDPGSPLSQLAEQQGFRKVFFNFSDIGGRYSVLSYFGLVPAALMGMNVGRLLDRADTMAKACARTDGAMNPGVALGAAMGELALQGRDKLTFLMPRRISLLGPWLEQLIAESTGKEGKGILPVVDEPLADPSRYGTDRIFVHMKLKGVRDRNVERLVGLLRSSGAPVIEISLTDLYDLGREFFRWEVATATAGHVLAINPFDQPNVQESKDLTKALLKKVAAKGSLPPAKAAAEEGPLQFFSPMKGRSGAEVLKGLFSKAGKGGYLAILAYLTETPVATRAMEQIRAAVTDTLGIAVTAGYGPRYLHSTGQLHKGGTNQGIFLQITAEGPEDAAIPGTKYGFDALIGAQALGDMASLEKRGRPIVRVHLRGHTGRALALLAKMVDSALRKS